MVWSLSEKVPSCSIFFRSPSSSPLSSGFMFTSLFRVKLESVPLMSPREFFTFFIRTRAWKKAVTERPRDTPAGSLQLECISLVFLRIQNLRSRTKAIFSPKLKQNSILQITSVGWNVKCCPLSPFNDSHRRYMYIDKILPIRPKTLSNQPIKLLQIIISQCLNTRVRSKRDVNYQYKMKIVDT